MLEEKQFGRVFTPDWVADSIIEETGFPDAPLSERTVFEPGFGGGSFLKPLIREFADYGIRNRFTLQQVGHMIDRNLYGIELDPDLCSSTVVELKAFTWDTYKVRVSLPHLTCGSALTYKPGRRFDYIIGNPPYVRIHNMPEKDRAELAGFRFAGGTSDLYVAFFEKGLQLLAPGGHLAYITPNTWLRNTSQKHFREYLLSNRRVKQITDFGTHKIFPNADTYTAITHITDTNNTLRWIEHDPNRNTKTVTDINYNNLTENPSQPLAVRNGRHYTNTGHTATLGDIITVAYGLATNRNHLFVLDDHTIRTEQLEPTFLRPAVKGATYKGLPNQTTHMFFPYHYNPDTNKWEPITEDEFRTQAPNLYAHYQAHRPELERRNTTANTLWFWYGRTQSIQHTAERKLIIPHTLPDTSTAHHTHIIPGGTLTYTGIYGIAKPGHTLEQAQTLMNTADFVNYAKAVGKNLGQGYRSLYAKMVADYPLPK